MDVSVHLTTTTSVEEVLGCRCLTVVSDTLSGGVLDCRLCAEGRCESGSCGSALVTSNDEARYESSDECGGTSLGVVTSCESGSRGSALVTRAGSVSGEGTSCGGSGLSANRSSDASVGVATCCEEGVVCLGTDALVVDVVVEGFFARHCILISTLRYGIGWSVVRPHCPVLHIHGFTLLGGLLVDGIRGSGVEAERASVGWG